MIRAKFLRSKALKEWRWASINRLSLDLQLESGVRSFSLWSSIFIERRWLKIKDPVNRLLTSEHSLSIFQTSAASCLARRDLRTCLLAIVLQLFSIRVLVEFDIYGVRVYKVFEDKTKKQYSLWIVQTPAVSCVVRRENPYLLANVSREQLTFRIVLLTNSRDCGWVVSSLICMSLSVSIQSIGDSWLLPRTRKQHSSTTVSYTHLTLPTSVAV